MTLIRSNFFLVAIATLALFNVASCFQSSANRLSLMTNRRAAAARGRPLHAAAKTTKTKKTAAKKKTEEVVNFKKGDFVASIAEKTGFTKADSEVALAAVLDTITEEVALGKRISLLGFGTFKLSYRKARKGRNPKTGEEIDIKESYAPTFSASKSFKEKVNPDR